MIPDDAVPPVNNSEVLARFSTQSNHFRISDQTVKQDAFIPPATRQLSVMRHLYASELEIWMVGRNVAGVGSRRLYGRADIKVQDCLRQGLQVVAAPISGNANHADIVDWPTEKPQQKIIAAELAATAKFVPCPTE